MENLSPVSETGMTFEKVDVQIIKIKKAGEYFVGKYVEVSDRPWIDDQGEEKMIKQLNLTDLTGKNPFAVFADAGLMNAFLTANIKKGDVIKCVKGEKQDLGGGRSVNSWSILKATTTH